MLNNDRSSSYSNRCLDLFRPEHEWTPPTESIQFYERSVSFSDYPYIYNISSLAIVESYKDSFPKNLQSYLFQVSYLSDVIADIDMREFKRWFIKPASQNSGRERIWCLENLIQPQINEEMRDGELAKNTIFAIKYGFIMPSQSDLNELSVILDSAKDNYLTELN